MRARLLAALLLATPAALACSHHEGGQEASEGFKLIHADDLQKLQATGGVNVYDANAPDYRQANGIIPGAHLLSGLEYDTARELPVDKGAPLVFYCTNSH